jgi:glycosyltransferase involved in cell wall biosynthesis
MRRAPSSQKLPEHDRGRAAGPVARARDNALFVTAYFGPPATLRPRVVLLRGHQANPWDLRPWGLLSDSFDVTCLVTASNEFDTHTLPVPVQSIGSVRDRLPAGRLGRALAYTVGDRYHDLETALRGADIVHAAELHTWFSAQASGLRKRLGFCLVLTVWETIPGLESYRWPRERRYRRTVLRAADLLLPATERARRALLLEGVEATRIQVCYPGIDSERFAARDGRHPEGAEHLVLSPGRLVWEKGHQDVIRAVAALKRGLLGPAPPVRLLIVGSGPEDKRLRRHARELGLQGQVEFRASVPYGEMPALYNAASSMVLASLQRQGWEEQFGMVLAEALATGTSVVAARSGAIPEVVSGEAILFDPGDWFGLAAALLGGPLSRAPAERVSHDPDRVALFSAQAAAQRLRSAYQRLLLASRDDLSN